MRSQHAAQLKTRFGAGCFALVALDGGFLLRAPGVVFSSNTDLLLRQAGSPCPERYKASGKEQSAMRQLIHQSGHTGNNLGNACPFDRQCLCPPPHRTTQQKAAIFSA